MILRMGRAGTGRDAPSGAISCCSGSSPAPGEHGCLDQDCSRTPRYCSAALIRMLRQAPGCFRVSTCCSRRDAAPLRRKPGPATGSQNLQRRFSCTRTPAPSSTRRRRNQASDHPYQPNQNDPLPTSAMTTFSPPRLVRTNTARRAIVSHPWMSRHEDQRFGDHRSFPHSTAVVWARKAARRLGGNTPPTG